MNPVWANEIYIGTAYTAGQGGAAGTWTYAQLCKGIENVTFNSNEQNQQYFFLCGEGVACLVWVWLCLIKWCQFVAQLRRLMVRCNGRRKILRKCIR